MYLPLNVFWKRTNIRALTASFHADILKRMSKKRREKQLKKYAEQFHAQLWKFTRWDDLPFLSELKFIEDIEIAANQPDKLGIETAFGCATMTTEHDPSTSKHTEIARSPLRGLLVTDNQTNQFEIDRNLGAFEVVFEFHLLCAVFSNEKKNLVQNLQNMKSICYFRSIQIKTPPRQKRMRILRRHSLMLSTRERDTFNAFFHLG